MQSILAELENHYDELFLLNFERGTHHWVHVTHICNPGSFYVRHTISSKFVNQLGSIEPSAILLSPILYDVVMTKLRNAPIFARSKITNIEYNDSIVKCDVFIMDFGYYVYSVPLQKIWQCNKRYKNIPPLITHCELDNCTPLVGEVWSQSSTNAFKYYVGNERARLVIKNKKVLPDTRTEKLVVDLNIPNLNDIATLLTLTGFSTQRWDHAYDMDI